MQTKLQADREEKDKARHAKEQEQEKKIRELQEKLDKALTQQQQQGNKEKQHSQAAINRQGSPPTPTDRLTFRDGATQPRTRQAEVTAIMSEVDAIQRQHGPRSISQNSLKYPILNMQTLYRTQPRTEVFPLQSTIRKYQEYMNRMANRGPPRKDILDQIWQNHKFSILNLLGAAELLEYWQERGYPRQDYPVISLYDDRADLDREASRILRTHPHLTQHVRDLRQKVTFLLDNHPDIFMSGRQWQIARSTHANNVREAKIAHNKVKEVRERERQRAQQQRREHRKADQERMDKKRKREDRQQPPQNGQADKDEQIESLLKQLQRAERTQQQRPQNRPRDNVTTNQGTHSRRGTKSAPSTPLTRARQKELETKKGDDH
jgi:hypothetical protein